MSQEETKIFDIDATDASYSFQVIKNKDSKSIKIIATDKKTNLTFQSSYLLELLKGLSKPIAEANDIDKAYELILKPFLEKGIKITKEDKILILSFSISNAEMKLTLEKKEMNESEIIKKVCKKLSTLEEEVKLLRLENKGLIAKMSMGSTSNETLLDIIGKVFAKCKYTLSSDLYNHLTEFGLEPDFRNEICKQFEKKVNIIFDSKKDPDTLLNFMTKIYGKKNIATFHSLTFRQNERKELSVQLAYINGKIEFVNGFFNFDQNDLFTYGNYQNIEGNEFCFTSFKAQNSRLYIKITLDSIYVIFYENDNMVFIAKIRDHFFHNPILILGGEKEDAENFIEENGEDKVDQLFENTPTENCYLNELLIYQIEEEQK
jgi:hypothetical protein